MICECADVLICKCAIVLMTQQQLAVPDLSRVSGACRRAALMKSLILQADKPYPY